MYQITCHTVMLSPHFPLGKFIRLRRFLKFVIGSGAKRSRNIFHKLTGDPSTPLRVTNDSGFTL